MIPASLLAIAATLTLGGATAALARNQVSATPGAGLLRVTSGTAGHEVAIRGVLLLAGHPMRVVAQSTPFNSGPMVD